MASVCAHVYAVKLIRAEHHDVYFTALNCTRTYLICLVAEVLDPVRLDGRRAVVAVGFPRQQHARLADLLDVWLRR